MAEMMEADDPYFDLKCSLSVVPVKALHYSSRLRLAYNLDIKGTLQSEKDYARDYRGLAELIGFPYQVSRKFERCENPTMKILEEWETWPNATLDKLISHLEDMERYDVIEELIPSLKKNVETYLAFQKSIESPIQVAEVTPGPLNLETNKLVITKHDMQNRECTMYDAYVSYADEDSRIAADFARVLEHPSVGLKLFIRGRDMLAGCPELDSNIEMIKNRCKHMLIILTPNFIKSPALEFQISFAGTLAIEQRQRILIPVIWTACEIPPILSTVSKIDFSKQYTHEWVMDKLISSLLSEEKIFLSPSVKSSPEIKDSASTSQYSVTAESRPAITFPPSTKHFISNVDNPKAILSITEPVDVSDDNKIEEDNKDSDVYCYQMKDEPILSPPKSGSSSKKLKKFWSHLKKKGNSVSASSASLSSSDTSGFHSQSSSSIKSLENSDDNCTGAMAPI